MFAEIQGKYIFVCVYCKVESENHCRHAINLNLQLDYGKPSKPFKIKVPSYLPLWFNSEFLILKSGESSFCVIYHKSPYLLPSDDSGLLRGHPPLSIIIDILGFRNEVEDEYEH